MKGPLSGIRVIDLTQVYNGPYATFLMAMGGADVIKVEPPGGEHLRRRQRDGGGQFPFAMLNGGKRFVELDLKTPEGLQTLEQLLADADLLVENFRPGVLARLGLTKERLEEINPNLILASSSGFGQVGAYRDYPAMDLAVQAMSGIVSVTGNRNDTPVKAGPAVSDFLAGIHLYAAAVTALLERERTGKVRSVEVAMLEASYPTLASNLGQYFANPETFVPRTGNRHPGMSLSPYNIYEAADGYIAIVNNNDRQFQILSECSGRNWHLDERFATTRQRVRNEDALDAAITEWTLTLPKEEIFQLLVKAGVPCAPVRELNEVVNDANLHDRGALKWIDHEEYGPLVVPTSPLVFEGLERSLRWNSRPLGADQEEVLAELAPAAEKKEGTG